ncbi:MAG: cytochrome b N-terminal domain-containing protein [Myxococcota bacterium]
MTPPAHPSFLAHLHPQQVTVRALGVSATWVAGLVALVLLVVLAVTGILLSLHYIPSAAGAHASVTTLTYAVPFGAPLRRVHRLASELLLVTTCLHLVRTVLVASAYERRVSYWVGLALGLVVLLGAWTGYILPWDETAFWGARVSSQLAGQLPLVGEAVCRLLFGARDVGPASVSRVHALHTTLVPMSLLVLSVAHLWRVRRDGGLAASGSRELVDTRPHLLTRELFVALVVLIVLLSSALLVPSTVGPAADLHRGANPEKAPWYFLGLQEMVSYGAPTGGLVYLGSFSLLLISVPWIAHWRQRAWRTPLLVLLGILALGLAWFTLLGALRGVDWLLPWPLAGVARGA